MFPKVRSRDHFWSAILFNLVLKTKKTLPNFAKISILSNQNVIFVNFVTENLYFMVYVSVSQSPVRGPFLVLKSFYFGPQEKKTYWYSKSLQKAVLKSIILGHFIYKTFIYIIYISNGPPKIFYQLLGPPIFFQFFLVRKLKKFGKHWSRKKQLNFSPSIQSWTLA